MLQGEVPLHAAVSFSTDGQRVEVLLDHGADACAKNLKVGFIHSCCALLGFQPFFGPEV